MATRRDAQIFFTPLFGKETKLEIDGRGRVVNDYRVRQDVVDWNDTTVSWPTITKTNDSKEKRNVNKKTPVESFLTFCCCPKEKKLFR